MIARTPSIYHRSNLFSPAILVKLGSSCISLSSSSSLCRKTVFKPIMGGSFQVLLCISNLKLSSFLTKFLSKGFRASLSPRMIFHGLKPSLRIRSWTISVRASLPSHNAKSVSASASAQEAVLVNYCFRVR